MLLKLNKCKSNQKFIIYSIILIVTVSTIWIASRPVSWDVGACGGGFETHIFEKYKAELIELLLADRKDKEQIFSAEVVMGSQDVTWDGRTIYMNFDVKIEYKGLGEKQVIVPVEFTGERYWNEKYIWTVNNLNRASE